MNLDNLASMLSQRSGAQQSTSNTIMSTIINYLMQRFMQNGVSSFLGSGGNDRDSMKSALSQLQSQTSDPNDELVQQVKNRSNLKDDNEARQYTQQALGLLQDRTDNEPQGLQSAFRSMADSQGFDLSSLMGGGQSQAGQPKKGGIRDVFGI